MFIILGLTVLPFAQRGGRGGSRRCRCSRAFTNTDCRRRRRRLSRRTDLRRRWMNDLRRLLLQLLIDR